MVFDILTAIWIYGGSHHELILTRFLRLIQALNNNFVK